MDLQSLRHFQQVAEIGSLSKASAKLGITQPTLTRQIKKLEEEFGAQLFYRNGRGVILTPAGRRVISTAEDILSEVTRLKSELVAEATQPSGQVLLGLPPSLCAAIGADLSLAFAEACPNATLRIHEMFSGALLEWVSSGRLDLAVLYDVRRSANLHVAPLLEEELFLVQATGMPPPQEPVQMRDLAGRPLILPGAVNGLRRVLDTQAAQASVTLSVDLEIDSTIVTKQLVERGLAGTILPYGAVFREVRDGRLQAFRVGSPPITALLVTAMPLLQPVSLATETLAKQLDVQVAACLRHDVLRGERRRLRAGAPLPRPGPANAPQLTVNGAAND